MRRARILAAAAATDEPNVAGLRLCWSPPVDDPDVWDLLVQLDLDVPVLIPEKAP